MIVSNSKIANGVRGLGRASLVAVMLLVSPAIGTAQQAAPAPTPAPVTSGEPETTTATFADWTLRCQRVGDGAQSKRTCDVFQTIQTKNPQGQPITFAQIALGYPMPGQPLHLVVALPVNISLSSVVNLSTDDKDAGVEVKWTNCLPAGCIAEAQVKDDVVRRWRTFNDPGRLSFKDAAGRDIVVATSYRGVGPALDALFKANAVH
jgi:invasion protein IalB